MKSEWMAWYEARSSGFCDFCHFLSAARSCDRWVRNASDSQGAGGERRAGLVVSGQRESRAKEREDRSLLEASSVDRRENSSAEGSNDRAADESRSGERDLRLRLVVVGWEVGG